MRKEYKKPNFKILFSIVAAVALWLFVVFLEDPSITMWEHGVEVNVSGERALEMQELVMVKESNPTVDVKLSGTRQGFYKKKDGDVTAQIDVSHIDKAGTYAINVKTAVSTQDASVIATSPTQLEIVIEPLVTVEKQVTVQTSGTCAEGFSVKDVSAPTVIFRGPKSVVDKISLQADPISVSGASEDVTQKRNVYMVDENGKKVIREDCTITERSVDVTCDIQYEKTVAVTTDIVGKKAEGYDYNFRTNIAQVTIYGEKEVLDQIETIKTEPVSISGITKMREVEVEFKLPEGVSVEEGLKVTVTIQPLLLSPPTDSTT